MNFKVKKGLSSPLKIQGMFLKYFYTWIGVAVFGVFIVFGEILSLTTAGSGTTLVEFVFVLLIVAAFIFGLKIVLVNKSKEKNIKEKSQSVTLSNIDITDILT